MYWQTQNYLWYSLKNEKFHISPLENWKVLLYTETIYKIIF